MKSMIAQDDKLTIVIYVFHFPPDGQLDLASVPLGRCLSSIV